MARPPTNVDLKFSVLRMAGDWLARPAIFNRQSQIGNRKSIDSLAGRLPVPFAASPAAQFTHLPPSETRIGSSSIMNCVLPRAPIIRVPVAANHFFDISSPVWQPQLFTKAWRSKTRRLILVRSLSCSHDLHALSMLLL